MVPAAEPKGAAGIEHRHTGWPADGHIASVDAVLSLWYARATEDPTALMNGTCRAMVLKLAWSVPGIDAGRVTTMVRFPADTVFDTTVTVLFRSVPMAWLAMRRSDTAPVPSTMIA